MTARTEAYPTPVLPAAPPSRWLPASLKPPAILALVLLMIGYAVGLEVALAFSIMNSGFSTTELDRVNAQQFVNSFLPVLAVIPLVFLWRGIDEEVRRLHPYVIISQGNATADESVLLDYIGTSRLVTLYQSLFKGHFVVTFSSAMVLLGLLYQPLAAGIFSVRLNESLMPGQSVQGRGTIGLRPGLTDLNSFAAAAGYAEAASVHGLGDPPFIFGGWAVGRFSAPPGLPPNGTIRASTVGIQTNSACVLADAVDALPGANGSFVVQVRWGGCRVAIPIASGTPTHYSVAPVENCGAINGVNPTNPTKPIVFNFFDLQVLKGQSFFCQPNATAFNIDADFKLATGLVSSVNKTGPYIGQNNFTAMGGRGFNGLFFDPSPDPFVQARALAIQSGVPGAIFRTAMNYPTGLADALQNVTYMLDLTNKIYTQHLSISAAEVYFLADLSPIPAIIKGWVPRLFLYAPPVHSLVAVFLLVALLAVFVHYSHWIARRNLLLSGPPGTIASNVSLTSQARFGALLNATDTPKDMSRKLDGLLFGIDPLTWQIVVEGEKPAYREKGAVEQHLLSKEDPTSPLSSSGKRSSGRESYFGSIVSPGPTSSRDPSFPRDSKLISPGLMPPLPPSPFSGGGRSAASTTGFASQQGHHAMPQPQPYRQVSGATLVAVEPHPTPFYPGARPPFFPAPAGSYHDPYAPPRS